MLAERLWDLGSEEEEDEEMRLRLIVLLLGLLLLVVSVRFCCFGVATVPGAAGASPGIKEETTVRTDFLRRRDGTPLQVL